MIYYPVRSANLLYLQNISRRVAVHTDYCAVPLSNSLTYHFKIKCNCRNSENQLQNKLKINKIWLNLNKSEFERIRNYGSNFTFSLDDDTVVPYITAVAIVSTEFQLIYKRFAS
ncbi:hypothetical protein BpHYR1_031609 [Brachionus plicatilis]|uniref:Uncharacterized protein n=1 Tax=Brachionus plicatilis TaxID=10195 RepID=A0A3M7SIE2_BRAPC|nr:hypothetical protein BpHYR1_031609 [Brachionus plicatilis]